MRTSDGWHGCLRITTNRNDIAVQYKEEIGRNDIAEQ